jgi:hypothetical protein
MIICPQSFEHVHKVLQTCEYNYSPIDPNKVAYKLI